MVDQVNAAAGKAAAQPGGQFGLPSDSWQPPGSGGTPREDGTPDSAAAPPAGGGQQPPGAGQANWTARLESHGIRLTRGPASPGPLRRARDGQLFGGVAAGLAKRTGFSVGLIRAVIVVAALISTGYLAMPYVLAWLFIPAEGADSNIASKALTDKRGIGLAAGLTSVLIVVFVIASALNVSWLPALPVIVCAAGLVLISRNAPEEELSYLRSLTDPAGLTATAPRSRRVLRFAIGALLVTFGVYALLQGHDRLALLRPLGGIMLLVGGISLALGPWWLRIAREAVAERQARIRAEERAEMASRVHDSVLQTLALIQRRAGDQQQVVQLARAQERELRAWLFGGRPPGSMEGHAATVADGVRLIQQEVEAQHGLAVDAVTVGDCELDDDMSALLAAAREATVNAAKWSGADTVSVFAEVEPDAVSIFVRDRGRGFDPAAVPADRKGLAESVRARLARRGGSATIRSSPGEGTEISLRMPRPAEDRMSRRS